MSPWHLLLHQLPLRCQCGRTGPSPPRSCGCWSTQPSWRSRETQTMWAKIFSHASHIETLMSDSVGSAGRCQSLDWQRVWCYVMLSFSAEGLETNHALPHLLCPLQYSKHLFVHIGQTNPSYSDPLLEAVDIRQIYDKFPEKKGGLKELYEKGPQNAFFLVKFWVGCCHQLVTH